VFKPKKRTGHGVRRAHPQQHLVQKGNVGQEEGKGNIGIACGSDRGRPVKGTQKIPELKETT